MDSPPELAANVKNYARFAEAFSNQENGFSAEDLTNGDAMMSHDAALTAATAIRLNGNALTDPDSVAGYFLQLRCTHAVPGASGTIALDEKGNPIKSPCRSCKSRPTAT